VHYNIQVAKRVSLSGFTKSLSRINVPDVATEIWFQNFGPQTEKKNYE